MAAADSQFGKDLAVLKDSAKRVVALGASEPADCAALPFYADNAGTIKDAGNAALAIIGLLSM